MRPKEELFKFTVSSENFPVIDIMGKNEGRSAYLCKEEGCVKKAHKTGRIERALRCKADSSLYDTLKFGYNI